MFLLLYLNRNGNGLMLKQKWTNVKAGISQRSIPGQLFFLIYINDLSDGLTPNPKLSADDTSPFSVVQSINLVAKLHLILTLKNQN